MFELSLNQVTKYMGTTLLLENLNFQVYSGERVGIVGANGCGKSTILKMIAGIEPLNVYPGSWNKGYDFGWIAKPREATVAYLDQIPAYPKHLKVVDVLNLAFQEVTELEDKMRQMEERMRQADGAELEQLLNKYALATHQYEVRGGYDIREKFSKICAGLEFDQSFLQMPFHLLSGGEKTTVELGKLLMDRPDILLLDEPTNHLDMASLEWLEGYLREYTGIIIMVSHDRYFLDSVVNKIIEIENKTAQTFKGNYSVYMVQKEEQMRIQYEQHKEQQKQIQQMEKTVRDLRDWGQRADNNKFFRRAASLQIKLDKMDRIERPIFERQNMRLNLKTTQRSGNETIKVSGISKVFGDKVIFDDAHMMVYYGERVGLLGANGSGKTTFLRMLLGELPLDGGRLALGASVKAAYLPQQISFTNENHTVLECFRDDVVMPEGKAREYLAKYMFYGSSVFTKVSGLSGGERVRLKLAKLLYEEANLLILDEPTNHLDIDSIETIEEALESFKGTIFFISHDRYFINKISERIVAIEEQKFTEYLGNYDDYKNIQNQILQQIQLLEQQRLQQQGQEKLEAARKQKKGAAAASKSTETKPGKPSPEKLEKEIEKLELALKEIDDALEACGGDYQAMGDLFEQRKALSEALDGVWATYEKCVSED